MNGLPPQRPQALLLSYADQYLEVYTSPGLDTHVVRVPWGANPPTLLQDEDVLTALVPERYRHLLDARRLTLNATTRPLTPAVLRDALQTQQWIEVLNAWQQSDDEHHELMQWVL